MSTREHRRRHPRRRLGDGGRRLHSAGSAIVVSLVGLGLALLLNAPGLHKSATIQPEGWKRDAALAVTGPLESVSATLRLDQPRRALKAAIGREDDDEIDTLVTGPEKPPNAQPAVDPAKPPRRERFSARRPLPVWIAGDSLVVIPGQSVERAVAGNPAVAAMPIDGRISTGLGRPDVFNWFTHVDDVMRTRKPKPRTVVVMFGANDTHDYMTGLPRGKDGRLVREPELARRVPAPRGLDHGHGDDPARVPGLDRAAGDARRRPDAALRSHQRDRSVRGRQTAWARRIPRHLLLLRGRGRRLRPVRRGRDRKAREDASGGRRALRARRGRPHRGPGLRATN